MHTSLLVILGSGCIAGTSIVVLAHHLWSRWRAPKLAIPKYIEGRFYKLEREILGSPPEVPATKPLHLPSTKSDIPDSCEQENGEPSRVYRDGRLFKGFKAHVPQKTLIGAATFDGATPAMTYALTWSQVDDHLFPAIGQLTHEHVTNMADLGRAIAHWDSVSQWSEPSAALVAKVKGHLAEFVAADHLQNAGHHVEMAQTSTQPGWDLDVDSVEVNVKSVDHFSSLTRHFSEYPDIPVLVPHDTLGVPEGAIHYDGSHVADFVSAKEAGATVFVDHALSNADVSASAEAGLDVGSGHIHLHIPWITMGISALREGMLLIDGNTDFTRALKNVAIDTAAVGGAGALGAKAGGAIGTFIAPGIGSILGAVIGGIGGALFGRSVANSVKRAPLDAAKGVYDTAVNRYQDQLGRTTREADRIWQQEREGQVKRLNEAGERAKREAIAVIDSARQDLERSRQLSPEDARLLLEATEATILDKIANLQARLDSVSKVRELLWPTAQFFSCREALPQYKAFYEDWKTRRSGVDVSSIGAFTVDKVFDLTMPVTQGEYQARVFLVGVSTARKLAFEKAESARTRAVNQVATVRNQAIKTLNDCKDKLGRWINSEMRSSLASLQSAHYSLTSEMRKAGIDV